MNARNGKIARLPRSLRDELNERLECSAESPELLDWLNALPEVKEVVQKNFAGVPINKQNLSEWRQGGFQEWLARRDLCEQAEDLAGCASDMEDCGDGVLADAAATVLAARLGSLIANWDGEADEKFEAKSRVLNRLCRSVVQLQRGVHQAHRESLEVARMMDENEKAEQQAIQKKLTAPFFDALKMGPMAKLFGGGEMGRKIAEFILAIRSGRLDTEFEPGPADMAEEPVKPTRKRKNNAQKTNKPLEENEMESGKEEKSNRNQSGSVRVGQTDLVQPQPEDGD